MARFTLNILGCGSAKPTPQHLPACQVLDFRDKLYMIDCGEGAQHTFAQIHLRPSRLNHVFISHLHGDHFLGLLGLLSSMTLMGKEGEVVVHTFADGARIIGDMMNYIDRHRSYELRFNIIKVGHEVIYEDNALRVSTLPLKHSVPAVGFLFEEKGKERHLRGDMADFHGIPAWQRAAVKGGADFVKPDGTVIPNSYLTTAPDPPVRYAYCSDTMPSERVIPLIEGVDWLYHEATYDSTRADKARQYCHSTAAQAAEVARRAQAKHLIIGHYSARYDTPELLLREARAIFPATIAAAERQRLDLLR